METENLENKSQGYVLLHRTLLDAPYFKDAQYVQLWVYLILKANHKEVFFNGTKIPRGGLITGRKKISDDTWINESKVERMLDFLESEQQIEQLKTARGRMVIIKNWDKFQKVNNSLNNYATTGEQLRNNQTTTGEHIQVMNNSINENNVSNVNKFIKPTLKKVQDYCLERNNNVDAQRFIDHYEAVGWMRGKNKIKDWKSCVRTWENNSKNNFKEEKSKYNFKLDNESEVIDV